MAVSDAKHVVMGMMQRDGNIITKVVPNRMCHNCRYYCDFSPF